MNGQIDDKAFEEYLKRGTPVSQHYQALEADETPSDLDRQILARAEEAVRSPATSKRRAWQRWSIPVALAASAVLAVSIVIESGQHESALTRAPSYSEPALEVAPAPRELEERAIEPSAEAPAPQPVPAPNAADEADVLRERHAQARREQVERRSELQAVAVPPPPEALAKRIEPEAESGVAADSRAKKAFSDAAAQTASRGPARPVPVAPVPPLEAERPAATAAPARAVRGFASETQSIDAHTDPEAWLREIRELRAAGKSEEADREWKAFRESFPDHVVAEDDPAIGEE